MQRQIYLICRERDKTFPREKSIISGADLIATVVLAQYHGSQIQQVRVVQTAASQTSNIPSCGILCDIHAT